jgi:AraC-like DNA-binding protein
MKSKSTADAFFRQIGSLQQIVRLFDLMPDVSFFMKDREARFVALNRLGCEFCHVKSEREALGKSDRDFFPAERAEEYLADDREVMESGLPKLNRIELAPEREGSPHLVITHKIPLRDADGRVIGLAGFSRRIDNLRNAPATMRKLAATVARLHDEFAEPLTTAQLAQQAGLSISQFERNFRKAFGTSPHQYLVGIRVEHACRLLIETDDTVTAVAQLCGFYDHAHFTRSFASVMGTSPSGYRRDHQQPALEQPLD